MWNKIQRIYVGQYQVYPKTVPQVWLLGYRPLQSDLKDYSWNWNNCSWYSWTWSFGSVASKTWARVTRSSSQSTQHIVTPIQIDNYWKTIAGWIYFSSLWTAWQWFCSDCSQWGGSKQSVTIWLRPADNLNIYANPAGYINWSWWQKWGKVWNKPSTWTWYFWCLSSDNDGNSNFYINDTKIPMSFTWATWTKWNSIFRLWCAQSNNWSSVWNGTDGYIRHFAVYNRELTTDEILDYYNITS